MSGKQQPLVSLVTINYNQTNVTKELLHSLRKISYSRIEIIVVDNASKDKTCLELSYEFPEIKLIRNEKNLGFSGGNNTGIRIASGDYILLINNDVEVTPGFLEPMVEIFEKEPFTGMVSPKIVYHNRNELIQYAGSAGINLWTGRGEKTGSNETDKGQYDFIKETHLVHGACMMVSRRLIEKVGLLHEDYFLYYEEHDWAEHAKKQGFKIFYSGKSKIYHKESISTGRNSPLKTYYLTRSRLIFLKRNTPFPKNISSLIFFILLAIPKNILKFLSRMDFKNLRAFSEAILWHVGWKSKTLR